MGDGTGVQCRFELRSEPEATTKLGMVQRILVETLHRGGVVACPTETWVGLLADAMNPDAVARVKQIKGAQRTGAISVLLPDVNALDAVVEPLTPDALALAERYWPGPLTIVTRARAGLSALLLEGETVGVRVPGPSPALDLVRTFGGPLTATSANRTGDPPVKRAVDLPTDLMDELDGYAGGESPGGAPSTIVDVTKRPFHIIRSGALELRF